MEQTSFNNVILSSASDPFLNGGQQIASGSSSSATSTNGTPSHSYKGSLSPSSPSSEELPVASDLHRQPDKLPHANQLNNYTMDGRKLNTAPAYTNNAHNAGDVRSPMYQQNRFPSGADYAAQHLKGGPGFAAVGTASVNAGGEAGPAPHGFAGGQPQSTFPPYSQSASQLPNSMQTPNASSFFSNLESSGVTEFPAPGRAPSAAANQFPASNYPSTQTNAFAQSLNQSAGTHSNYVVPDTPSHSAGFGRPQSHNQRNEQIPNHRKPTIPDSFSQQSSLSSASFAAQYPKPSSGLGPEPTASRQTSLPAQSATTMQPPAPPPQQKQRQPMMGEHSFPSPQQPAPASQPPPLRQQYGGPAASRNAGYPASSVQPPTMNASTSYQNVSLYQNVSQPFPASQPAYTSRSQLQSPFDGNHSSQGVPGMVANQGPPASTLSGRGAATTVFPPNERPAASQMPPLMNPPAKNNHMYQMNGYQQAAPLPPAQGHYGPQYQPVSKQMGGRYPPQTNDMQPVNSMSAQFGGLSVTKQGFYGARGIDSCDLLRMRDILPAEKIQAPSIHLAEEASDENNCHPDIFRCTLTKVPQSKSLLDKSRLPLGILLHPFRDLTHLSVIQCSSIVRCRACRTYINPFVYFMDNRHWKCNLCFRANDLPDDFRYNPLTKMNDDPTRRPEVTNATIEFIASSEYMVRPPQPAIYLFVLDVSRIATQTGYLATVCEVLSANLSKLPGDLRTAVGFITVDSAVRFYDLGENLSQPRELIVTDVDDMFIPFPENLLVNLQESMELIKQLLDLIPEKFKESYDTNCALGAALQAAHKLMSPTGGRVTVFTSCLPNYGPGALKPREEPNQRGNNKSASLNPATDFYKKLALDCNATHVAVDLFVVNAQFVDLATISGISQISAGCMHHFPLYSSKNSKDVEKLVKAMERYLSRKIGFEAVLRLRCTRGLSIHSFHGNFFVRTTDLLALPNINPDAGFGMQVSIDESLSDLQSVCFQAALLYTSSKGERRIRVHTMCLPVTNNLHDVLVSADQQCIAGLLAKMAVDRSLQSSVADARDAFVNAVCDILSAYKMVSSAGQSGTLLAPSSLYLFPLYILGLLKSVAFRLTASTRTDDRVYAMYQMKCIPLDKLMQIIHPDLYPIHNLSERPQHEIDGRVVAIPPVMQLSAERVDSTGVYLLDEGDSIVIFICHNASPKVCQNLLGYPHFGSIPDNLGDLPTIETQDNKLAHAFISHLQSKKPNSVVILVLKDTAQTRAKFYERLVEDKTELGISYHEFLQNISSQMNH